MGSSNAIFHFILLLPLRFCTMEIQRHFFHNAQHFSSVKQKFRVQTISARSVKFYILESCIMLYGNNPKVFRRTFSSFSRYCLTSSSSSYQHCLKFLWSIFRFQRSIPVFLFIDYSSRFSSQAKCKHNYLVCYATAYSQKRFDRSLSPVEKHFQQIIISIFHLCLVHRGRDTRNFDT